MSNELTKTLNPQQNLDLHKEIHNIARKKSIVNFQKYRSYYDRKAKASPLEKDDFCFLPHPKITKHNDFTANAECNWLGLFKVVKKLTHSNYLVRKVNTRRTLTRRTRRTQNSPEKTFPQLSLSISILAMTPNSKQTPQTQTR